MAEHNDEVPEGCDACPACQPGGPVAAYWRHEDWEILAATTIQRGPVRQRVDRQYTQPLTGEMVTAIGDAGLVADDGDFYVRFYRPGDALLVGELWGSDGSSFPDDGPEWYSTMHGDEDQEPGWYTTRWQALRALLNQVAVADAVDRVLGTHEWR
jgi:hypothetical protein